ncbi:hypothetical protein EDD21DRAFT_112696 [Dissophora ornata]|nr:hypothetical protein EDD21DRAFT_112696 [Dissophora ornata]
MPTLALSHWIHRVSWTGRRILRMGLWVTAMQVALPMLESGSQWVLLIANRQDLLSRLLRFSACSMASRPRLTGIAVHPCTDSLPCFSCSWSTECRCHISASRQRRTRFNTESKKEEKVPTIRDNRACTLFCRQRLQDVATLCRLRVFPGRLGMLKSTLSRGSVFGANGLSRRGSSGG